VEIVTDAEDDKLTFIAEKYGFVFQPHSSADDITFLNRGDGT
jgi:hypothetical protein